MTSASPTPDAVYGGHRIFFDASDFPQSIERLGDTERAAAAEQTTDVADSSPRIVEQLEYPLIERLRGTDLP